MHPRAKNYHIVIRMDGKDTRVELIEALLDIGILVKAPNGEILTERQWEKASASKFVAKTMEDCATPRQLVAIRGICNSARFDAEDELADMTKEKGLKPEMLNRKTAGLFIDYLKRRQGELIAGES